MSLSAAAQTRCAWVTDDPLYIQYHDTEWGVPERDNHKLFEMICLEGQQAGLSWLVILKKRENYRQSFFQFDPEKVAAMTEADVDKLMQNQELSASGRKSMPLSVMQKPTWRCRRPVKISVIFCGISPVTRR